MLYNLWELAPVYQIHSSKRKDREKITKLWTRAAHVKIRHVEAIMKSPGHEGCALSHTLVSKQAPRYIVLEDDVQPTVDAWMNAQLYFSLEKISTKYDIIYLGGLPLGFPKSTSQYGIYEGKCLTTYAMLVNLNGKKWIENFKYKGIPIDTALSTSTLRTAFLDPPLFTQVESQSDIGHSSFTKSLTFARMLSWGGPYWRWCVIHSTLIFWAVMFVIVNKWLLNHFLK